MPRPEHRTLFRLAVGLAVLLGVMVGVGWAVTGPLAHDWPFTVEDGLDRSLARNRTPALDRWTGVVSTVSSTPYAIAITALATAGAWLVFRRWREPLFLAGAVAVEAAVFLMTTLVVDRPRPAVPALDSAPPTSSFPSGHTAAAFALYGGIALLASRRGAGGPAWVLLVFPLVVGTSRLYRGMHHPSDVVAGLLLGALVLVLMYRVAFAHAAERMHRLPSGVAPRLRGGRT